ncbi:MAG TPA: protein-glutamate O-methyltransferase CheR [Capsulimonadaceae bacterium]
MLQNTALSLSPPAIPQSDFKLGDKEFGLLRQLVYELTGISLADGKRTMLESRLVRRLRVLGLDDFTAYYKLLRDQMPQGAEIRAMINAVTTNKTEFFREKHHFDFVADQILPLIRTAASSGHGPRRLRVWHAGCSTGQEPYSLSMVILDTLINSGTWDIKLLASDIDTNVLQIAQEGVYKEDEVASVPPELLKRHFMRGRGANEGMYQVKDAAKQLIKFRHINLLEEPWPISPSVQFDIIFCRNVVIYFDKQTQRRLFQRYYDKLKPGGHLFIGHSETLHGISDSFDLLGGTIYQKSANSR